MVDVKTEVLIKCPIDRVAAYASNPDNAPEWYVNIKSVEWVTQKPLTIGSKVAFKAKFLGRVLAYTYEFVELIEDTKLVMKTTQGPFPMETTYTWMSVDDKNTRMTLRNRGIPSGFSRLFTPFISMAMKKANTKDLILIKKILENQQ